MWDLLFVLFYFLFTYGHLYGFAWGNSVYTQRGIIQIPSEEFGFCLVFRSPNFIWIAFAGRVIKLNRVIPPSKYRIVYKKSGVECKCSFELGPPLLLEEGSLQIFTRVKSGFGGRWNLVQETNVWPPVASL
jgi:hypothetical protein